MSSVPCVIIVFILVVAFGVDMGSAEEDEGFMNDFFTRYENQLTPRV